MNSDHDNNHWQRKVDQIVEQAEQDDSALMQRLSEEDPDLADSLKANHIQARLDDIGLQKTPASLHKKLYAIADQSNLEPSTQRSKNKTLLRWGAMVSAAAILMVTVLLSPWQQQQPSAEEIAQARNELAMTFFYLNKAANLTRQTTQNTIAEGVQTAMSSSQFLGSEDETMDL